MENNNKSSDLRLDVQRIIDISGTGQDKKTKAHIICIKDFIFKTC